MQTGEDVVTRDIPVHQGYLFLAPVVVQIAGGKKSAELGGQLHIHHMLDAGPENGVAEHIIGTYHGPDRIG
ncbi:hypothetical protein GCM10010393_33850 [Streptomyces gobitricini]|uniref:Uncharacterized protein n=1 Tax=Streptomyces gobitricini TaxID=68211 RepID=A0ABP5ZPV0_9ACTN